MAERRIVVPDGMFRAAGGYDFDCIFNDQVRTKLEAALRWLSENPIVPTAADALTLLQERVASGHLSNKEYCAIPATTIRCVIREWQRRMFLAPELSQAANQVIRSMRGCTFTASEADAIVEELSHVSHGWTKQVSR